MPRYKVMVDDNFHYQQPEDRWEQGVHPTLEAALAACRAIVDRSLEEERRPGISAEALFNRYTSFGDDPSIERARRDGRARDLLGLELRQERARAICDEP